MPFDDDPVDRPRRRAGLRADERDPDDEPGPPGSAGGGIHAAGDPAGGLAVGGLGGTNTGNGSVDEELADAFGSGIFDTSGDCCPETDEPYAGPAGGAVGGTPANKRATGGRIGGGIAPGNDTGLDRTIGSDPAPHKPR